MASPPHLPQLSIPRKRGSISSVTSAAKKRKPSQLRNAFSPESEGVGSPLRYSRSPSVDSVATGSVANSSIVGGVGGGGRKRRRKDKGAPSTTGSLQGGKGQGSTTGADGDDAAARGEADPSEESSEEEQDAEETMLATEGGKYTEATRRQEEENRRILQDYMTSAQKDRFDVYRAIRLKRETVRKLVNQTLSQSVPYPVVVAVTSYSKAFIGDVIDRALTVRDEWSAARTHLPNPDLPPQLLRSGLHYPRNHKPGATPQMREIGEAGLYAHQVPPGSQFLVEVEKNKGLKDRLREEDKGPLTPAHLREALRRYKRDREGGGAGVAGMSLEGVERTMARTGGRRLFR
ncbi:uncharacterized protein EI97DRAFT_421324 [Westerdykella ornata]|uniref:TAFII28-like protein domain-containing protein n=1 Tax=Westerdykella ornata TaxID=318751 RepID=A0A6A6JFR5_WESOR|nr:uncharacterized protein EI97DRAFT_421324 [Westerdykella ornata]KAF2275115.1 hypothetical protein EI97DRAFT_421324 [Westerdykella ornata]